MDVHACSAQATSNEPYDPLKGVPKEYHDFVDIFSKSRVQVLSEHQPYDLKIELEEGIVPLSPGHLYSLSTLEQEALQKFIQENLNIGFIHPSKSGHSVPAFWSIKRMAPCACALISTILIKS